MRCSGNCLNPKYTVFNAGYFDKTISHCHKLLITLAMGQMLKIRCWLKEFAKKSTVATVCMAMHSGLWWQLILIQSVCYNNLKLAVTLANFNEQFMVVT
jgi:hypothetical protein